MPVPVNDSVRLELEKLDQATFQRFVVQTDGLYDVERLELMKLDTSSFNEFVDYAVLTFQQT